MDTPEGFYKLVRRDVPRGTVLSTDNEHTFPLIDTGTFISKDFNWKLEPSFFVKGAYEINPMRPELDIKFLTFCSRIRGTIEHCLEQLEKLKATL